LVAGMMAGECAGQGHFRFANIFWERNTTVGGFTVTYTIRSSWQRTYPEFQKPDLSFPVVGDTVRLRGLKTPTLSTVDTNVSAPLNISLINLDLHVTSTSTAGDWITGTTVITQEYSGLGPYEATFHGCCVAGVTGNTPFSITTQVDMGASSFAPAIVPVPIIYAEPGRNFSLPAQHPRSLLGPAGGGMFRFKWQMGAGVSGVTLEESLGVVGVPLSATVGSVLPVVVRVHLLDGMGSPTGSWSEIAQNVHVMAVGGPVPAMPMPAGMPSFGALSETDRTYEQRTGFSFSIEVVFAGVTMPGSGDALEVYTNEGLPGSVIMSMVPAQSGQAPTKLMLAWDRPCVGDEQAIDFCFAAREIASGTYLPQMCLSIKVLLDLPPAFVTPTMNHYMLRMGAETSFQVEVLDAAVADEVSFLGLAPTNTLPTGATLSTPELQGNRGKLTFAWTPLPTAGGSDLTLCLQAKDIPATTYDQCRSGARSNELCIRLTVEPCKYVVRDKETIADVASLFATDWVQLWALNPSIMEPDYEVGKSLGTVLSTGHMYRVDSGDYLNAIAFKFGTTLKHILMLNANLTGSADAVLEVGSDLCVMPNSCIRETD